LSRKPASGYRPPLVAGPGPAPPARRARRLHGGLWPDRIIGIVLGIVLGIGIITAFVFLGSEGTIDAPSLNESQQNRAAPPAQSEPPPRIQGQ
jgi:hypothetical protein